MLSVVVYGRNDNHGYNMHKRIAISLNAIAEVLTHEDDEILYVDYNTSNDLPTVIEAIQDTLTEKAKKLTRVFRVRPEIHDLFKNKTHAQVNEPLARNIAIRRSNPKNRWILSSNTDMVFVPQNEQKSLSDVVAKAKDGFYELARFDVPEPLWESLDRKNPTDIIAKFKDWGKSLHLNEVVYGNPIIVYDAPGDFQLMLRDDIFKINGFDERMILGWHVDSNLCKRMHLLRGKVESLQDEVYGYHCNHTRMSGWAHSIKRKAENSAFEFFDSVTDPYVKSQENSWGLADCMVEEISANKNDTLQCENNLRKIIEREMQIPFTVSNMNHYGVGEICYSTNHVIPFLYEQIILLREKSNIVYAGYNKVMFEFLKKISSISGKEYNIFLYQYIPDKQSDNHFIFAENAIEHDNNISKEDLVKTADLLIFDFGIEEKHIKKYQLDSLEKLFYAQSILLRCVALERCERSFKTININVHTSGYYRDIKKYFNPIQNPMITHMIIGHKSDVIGICKNYFVSDLLLSKVKIWLTRDRSLVRYIFILPVKIILYLWYFVAKYYVKKIIIKKRYTKSLKLLKKIENRYAQKL